MMNEIENRMVKKAINGDCDAFEQIVLTYEKKVYNIAYQMFNNEQDAYDVSQEIFIKLYKNISSFKFDSSFSTWLHRLAVNTCIDAYRKRKRQLSSQAYSIDEPVENDDSSHMERQFEDTSPGPEAIYIQNETVQEVQNAIQMLKEEFKSIIIMRDLQGHSYEELSEIFNCSLGTVKSRLARARTSLKNIILANGEQKT